MHSILGVAGLLGLVALAFGQRAASVCAAIILLGVPTIVAGLFLWRYLISIGAVPPI